MSDARNKNGSRSLRANDGCSKMELTVHMTLAPLLPGLFHEARECPCVYVSNEHEFYTGPGRKRSTPEGLHDSDRKKGWTEEPTTT